MQPPAPALQHLLVDVQGFIQGVGFRPLVLRLANEYGQKGWVANTLQGAELAIEGCAGQQQLFLAALSAQLPPFAAIKSLTTTRQPLAHFQDFRIQTSTIDGKPSVFVLPDLACCPHCIGDIYNPDSRFYRYPFTSCCHCGPRYSIMRQQPYDRNHTSMAAFSLCDACLADYHATDDRRCHAQTLACPYCGPQLQLLNAAGHCVSEQDPALMATAELLRSGHIVAIKSIGGFQLLVDASNQQAVERLRQRKQRPCKPFALMVADMPAAHQLAVISPLEQRALTSPAAPIVLLKRRANTALAPAVAPDHPWLGIMLAYSPLHHLLLAACAAPLVATSGNRHNEPICTSTDQALLELAGIADYFLTHDRIIVRPLDDSIVRVINGTITVLRRARGYAPLPIALPAPPLPDGLAVGGHLKNTVAISQHQHIILSPHIGDLDSLASQRQWQKTTADLQDFYQAKPSIILHDRHNAYASSQLASQMNGVQRPVQHHVAHALACMAEHQLVAPALAIVWDGNGLGDDGLLWGGEFLLITPNGYQRYAHLRTFALPGGSKAIQEPRRAALGLLYEIYGDAVFQRENLPFSAQELVLLQTALQKQLNCPRTSSAGRLFDAIASLLGVCQYNHYEGQAAMALEALAEIPPYDLSLTNTPNLPCYDFRLLDGAPVVIDWQPMIGQMLLDLDKLPLAAIAVGFHHSLANMMLAIAEQAGCPTVVLSGGCMQNAYLVSQAVQRLKNAGFAVYCQQNIPPNDGGLAAGQLYALQFIGQTPCA